MSLLATQADVTRRLARPLLSAEEVEQTNVLLEAALLRLARRIPNLVERAADDADFCDLVVEVQASSVARVLRNPDGFRSESAGQVSYTLDTRVASGFLMITDEEWELLGVSNSSAFTIAPSFPRRNPHLWGF